MLKSKQLATLLGIGVLLVVFVVGLLSAMYLINISQDIRQQASTKNYPNEELTQNTYVQTTVADKLMSDLNSDQQVNLDDFNILRAQLMTTNPDPSKTDINRDGRVDIIDFSYMNLELKK